MNEAGLSLFGGSKFHFIFSLKLNSTVVFLFLVARVGYVLENSFTQKSQELHLCNCRPVFKLSIEYLSCFQLIRRYGQLKYHPTRMWRRKQYEKKT